MSSNDQTERNIKNPVVAIAGATGAVGVELMQCLEQRKFPLVGAAPAGLGALGRQDR